MGLCRWVGMVGAEGLATGPRGGRAFGFSRQSNYTAARALADEGPGGPVAKPGPRGAHKLTDEVLGHLEGLREADPGLGPTELAGRPSLRWRSPSGSGSRFIAARWSERSPARRPLSGARKVADVGEHEPRGELASSRPAITTARPTTGCSPNYLYVEL